MVANQMLILRGAREQVCSTLSDPWHSLSGGLLVNARHPKTPAKLAQHSCNIHILRMQKQVSGHSSRCVASWTAFPSITAAYPTPVSTKPPQMRVSYHKLIPEG